MALVLAAANSPAAGASPVAESRADGEVLLASAMLPSHVAPSTERMVESGLPELQGMLETALPPPPDKAVLQTRMFGTVTVDHRAHLARHISCKRCHGPGVVSKFGYLPPPVAHERCVGCHKEQERGPTKCRECHVTPPPPAPVVAEKGETQRQNAESTAANAAGAGKAGGATAGPRALADKTVTAAVVGLAGAGRPAFPGGDASTVLEHRVYAPGSRGVAEATYSFVSSGTAGASGPGFRFTMGAEHLVYSESIDVLSGPGVNRLLGLFGAGVVSEPRWRGRLFAVAVGGFDATTAPRITVAPAVGARVGAEWQGNVLFRNTLGFSVFALSTLTGSRQFEREQVGPFTFGVSASIGAVLRDSQ